MRTAGIICEYNPFHRGHRFQIQETRRRLGDDTAIVCLMSGNYVQRGEPAIFDKWTRAESAIHGGADLVLELPLTIAVNAAGYFAFGAVQCLHALGGVDSLSFGSERGDLDALQTAAALLESPDFDPALRQQLAAGHSFARARELALKALGGDGTLLQTPNNALGVDYLRSLLQLGSSIQPFTVPRDETQATASDLRAMLLRGDCKGNYLDSQGKALHSLEYGQRAMLAVLRSATQTQFQQMPFGSEGLWSKVMKAVQKETTLEEILTACKSKRYAYARLKRMLLCLYLGLTGEDLQRPVPYLRVLAFNGRGRELLRRFQSTSRLPLISGPVPRDPESQAYYDLERRATDLYGLFAEPDALEPVARERSTPPVYVR